MAEDADQSLDEKRVHAEDREGTRAVVACGLGLATVDISGDQVGRFGLAHRLEARAVTGNGHLAVATDGAVLVGDAAVLERTGFGPAVAVGFVGTTGDGKDLLAAGPDGRVARVAGTAATDDGGEWREIGTLDRPARAIDGDLLAAEAGVYRASEGLVELGLDDVQDVAAAGPYAATPEGVFVHDEGWQAELEGEATAIASDGARTHAVVDGRLQERVDDTWQEAGCSADGVVAIAHGPATYAVTADGTFLVDAATARDGVPGWRSRELGLAEVTGLAVL